MISKLVTVTCKKDVSSIVRQAESIQKFLQPCEHLVIIEDVDCDKDFWLGHLSKYYVNHKLTIKSCFDLLDRLYREPWWLYPQVHGWHRQQAFKLLASQFCDDKYLVLDSKDFFIRHNSLQDWDDYQGSNIVINRKTLEKNAHTIWLNDCVLRSAKYFHDDPIDLLFEPITPFVIDTKHLDHINVHDLVEDFFAKNNQMGEFVLYSHLAQEDITNFRPHQIEPKNTKLWNGNRPFESYIKYIHQHIINATNNDFVFVFSIHRDVIKTLYEPEYYKTKLFVNKWIKSLGLTHTI